MGKFSSAVDDIRHKLGEEGWYGRKVTGAIEGPGEKSSVSADGAGNEKAPDARPPHRHSDLYASVWGKEPAAADLYGKGPAPSNAPSITSPPVGRQTPGPEPEV